MSKIFNNKRALYGSFVGYLIGNVLHGSAITGLNNLQTSLNIEDGLGATTLWLALLSSLFIGVFLGPILIRFFGFKKTMIGGAVCFLGYTVANFYASYYTLVPGALCFGIGRALGWTCAGTFIAVYASELQQCGTKSFAQYFGIANALHFASVQSSQMVGNLVIYAIFSSGIPSETPTNSSSMQEFENSGSEVFARTSTAISNVTAWRTSEICAANDCQNPEITRETISQYQAPTETIRFLTIAILVVFVSVSIALHVIFLPNVTEQNRTQKKTEIKAFTNKAFSQEETKEQEDKENKNVATNGTQCEICVENKVENEKQNTETNNVLDDICYEIQTTLKHFIKPHQLLLTAIQFQAGFHYSFIGSEITRAYVSCVYGATMVGVSMSLYGASSFLSSIFAGRLSGKIGRKYVVVIGYVAAISFYLFCLLWIPNEESSIGVVFGLLILSGFVDAHFRTISSEITLTHFLNEKKPAYVCWFVWMSIGMLTQYAWSTSVCVRTKIYVMIATVTLAVVTYGIAEHLYEKKKKNDEALRSQK